MSATATIEPPLATTGYQEIPIEWITISKTNPRRHFDEGKLAELAKSVAKKHGIIEPLLCRPPKKPAHPNAVELVAGERRYRAGVMAKLQKVPVIIREMTDQEALEIQLIENIQREDMNEIEEGKGFAALLAFRGEDGKTVHTVQSIAERINKNISHIYARLKVAEVSEPVEKAFYDHKISAGHAIELARLQPADQAVCLEETIRRDMSVKALREWIQRYVHLDLTKAPFPTDDEKLLPAAGSCVTCVKRSGTQPELFPDIRSKDTCTDRACYSAKTAALVNVRVEETAGAVRISSCQSNQYNLQKQKGVTYRDNFTDAGAKSCDHTVTGIWIDGSDVGKPAKVCTAAKCKVHSYRPGLPPPSPAEAAKRSAEALKARQDGEIRRQTFAAVIAKVKGPLSRGEMVWVARTLFAEMHHDTQKALMPYFKIEPRKPKHGSADLWSPTMEWIEQADDYQMAQFLIGCTLVTAPDPKFTFALHKELKTTVPDACRRYKVDTEVIRRQVIENRPAAKPAPGAKEELQTSAKSTKPKSGRLDAAGRKRVAALQKKRWAEFRKTKQGAAAAEPASSSTPVFSPPGRRNIRNAAAAR